MPPERTGIYAEKGDYHKNLDPNWAYAPIFNKKMKLVEKSIFALVKKGLKILDAGCGEGFFVENLRNMGYDAVGLDSNFKSGHVIKGNMEKMPFSDGFFDAVVSLDSLQYLALGGQKAAIKEFSRVLKGKGVLVLSLPNLHHFANKLHSMFKGGYRPTDSKTRPTGDNSLKGYIGLINPYFDVISIKGILPTNFLISCFLITKYPGRFNWLFNLINNFAYPPWCYYNLIICRKK